MEANRSFINSKSDKVLYERFCNDFDSTIEKMGFDPSEENIMINCE